MSLVAWTDRQRVSIDPPLPGALRFRLTTTGCWRGAAGWLSAIVGSRLARTTLHPSTTANYEAMGAEKVESAYKRKKPRGVPLETFVIERRSRAGTCRLVADVIGPLTVRTRRAFRVQARSFLTTLRRQSEQFASKSAAPAAPADAAGCA